MTSQSTLDALRSGEMDDLLKAKSWMETEVASALGNAGLDASKLSGIKMAVHDGKVEVAKNQENLTEDERMKIEAALNAPENGELWSVMAQVLQDEYRISASLRKVTGLSTTDWEEVMRSGGDFANADNGVRYTLAFPEGKHQTSVSCGEEA